MPVLSMESTSGEKIEDTVCLFGNLYIAQASYMLAVFKIKLFQDILN